MSIDTDRAMNALKPALPRSNAPGSWKILPGWVRMSTRRESTRLSDLISVPSRSTQSGRSELSGASGEETALVLDWGKDHLIEKHSKYTVG